MRYLSDCHICARWKLRQNEKLNSVVLKQSYLWPVPVISILFHSCCSHTVNNWIFARIHIPYSNRNEKHSNSQNSWNASEDRKDCWIIGWHKLKLEGALLCSAARFYCFKKDKIVHWRIKQVSFAIFINLSFPKYSNLKKSFLQYSVYI